MNIIEILNIIKNIEYKLKTYNMSKSTRDFYLRELNKYDNMLNKKLGGLPR